MKSFKEFISEARYSADEVRDASDLGVRDAMKISYNGKRSTAEIKKMLKSFLDDKKAEEIISKLS